MYWQIYTADLLAVISVMLFEIAEGTVRVPHVFYNTTNLIYCCDLDRLVIFSDHGLQKPVQKKIAKFRGNIGVSS